MLASVGCRGSTSHSLDIHFVCRVTVLEERYFRCVDGDRGFPEGMSRIDVSGMNCLVELCSYAVPSVFSLGVKYRRATKESVEG